ncbi:hypothetical protein SEA_VIEENROSE_73 [Streptomyces phage VieEnRose]|nr:hypothetical protein SEA_VIEENROSE_73 [Streptomyces phage VieEnRose]
MSYEIDIDVLREYAAEALERPRDAAFWDERCYSTHVPVLGWADRGDDVLEESNFFAALDLIEGAAEDESHWFRGSSSHWLVGSLEQIWVQVYEDVECEGHHDDDYTLESGVGIGEATYCDGECVPERDREFTAAFREAVSISEALKDYPVLDDSDYSEREWKQFEETLEEALDSAVSEYLDVDDDHETEAIKAAWYEDEDNEHRRMWCRSDDVDWDVVSEEYKRARDAYFLERATEVYRWNVLGYNPDQLELNIPA